TGRRLTEELRDRRALVTSVTPSYLSFSDAGALMIAAATQPAREQEVIQLLLAEIERLRRGEVSEADIATSLRAIAGRRALYDELNLQQTERAATEVSGTLDSYAEYLARLRTVTAADVQRVAQQYLQPTNYTLVVVRR
ncbi:MAG TPA: insulinase family protein, partial [Chloroflexota bacterium]|nr:insulinase family protein [Chloroflexota bacterium]